MPGDRPERPERAGDERLGCCRLLRRAAAVRGVRILDVELLASGERQRRRACQVFHSAHFISTCIHRSESELDAAGERAVSRIVEAVEPDDRRSNFGVVALVARPRLEVASDEGEGSARYAKTSQRSTDEVRAQPVLHGELAKL